MSDLYEYARRIPKAELHVHLEGSIQPATLLLLARRNNIQLPFEDERGVQEFYRFRDFNHFLKVYHQITACLCTPQDYHLIAYEFGRECARQNVCYAEVIFTIETNMRLSGLPWQAILDGLNAGRAQAQVEYGVELRWIFDIVRDLPGTQETVLEIALAARDLGCVALGLGGNEAGFPPELFVKTFEQARASGLPRVVHAGEIAGPQSVWSALDKLCADRIHHGVRAAEDPDLVRALVERQIACDICPTSNICLGVYPDYASHPLPDLWRAGVFITLGSDDPPMFNIDLTREYQVLVEYFGFGADELEQISLNGLRASLLPEADKMRQENGFRAEFARSRQELS